MSEELIKRLQDEADLCRNEGADDIASLLDEAANALKAGDAPAFWVPENALDKRERGTLWSTFIANERHDEKLYKLTVPLYTRPAPAVQVPEGFSASVLEDAWCHAVPLTRPHFDRFMAVCREMAAAPAPATVATEPADPCPGCKRGSVCRTPTCGRIRSSELMALYGTPAPVATEPVAQEPLEIWVDEEFTTEAMQRLCDHLRGEGKPILADCLMGLAKQRDNLKRYWVNACAKVGELTEEVGQIKKPVAQGGGVDVEKVMALVEQYANERRAEWSEVPPFSAEARMAADDARTQIRALLTAAPAGVGGWIPVGERRPGVGVVVLGFWKNSAGPHSHVTGQNYGITARNEHGLWYDASEDDNEDDEWMRPDYWQPLPAAPAIANHREVE